MTNSALTVSELSLAGVLLLRDKNFRDARGRFTELWNAERYRLPGAGVFCQDNLSVSAKRGTLRGIHFQRAAAAQSKLVRPVCGAVRDVVVDLRPGSTTYLKWLAVTLSAQNADALFVPKGFGHAFLTLEDETVVFYKVDTPYRPGEEGAIRWNDPTLQIDWGAELFARTPILSEKDAAAPLLSEWLERGF